jgi:membrane-bound ClpP family serine protease
VKRWNTLIDLVASDEQHLLAQLDGRLIVRFDGRRETLRLSRAQVVDYKPPSASRLSGPSVTPTSLSFC